MCPHKNLAKNYKCPKLEKNIQVYFQKVAHIIIITRKFSRYYLQMMPLRLLCIEARKWMKQRRMIVKSQIWTATKKTVIPSKLTKSRLRPCAAACAFIGSCLSMFSSPGIEKLTKTLAQNLTQPAPLRIFININLELDRRSTNHEQNQVTGQESPRDNYCKLKREQQLCLKTCKKPTCISKCGTRK